MRFSGQIELVFFKAYADLRAEAARSYISFLWWVLDPLLYMCAFYVVFSLVLDRGGDDFVPFLLCGLVVWKWFDSTVKQGAISILANTGLIRQVYLPKFILPGAVVLSNTLKFSIVFVLLLLFLMIYGISPTSAWWALPLILATQLLFNTACAGMMSALVPFVPDIRQVIDNGMLLLLFFSGIFFDVTSLSDKAQTYLMLNPVAFLISSYREILLHGRWPGWEGLSLIAFASMAGIRLAGFIMGRLDRHYPKVLMS